LLQAKLEIMSSCVSLLDYTCEKVSERLVKFSNLAYSINNQAI